MEPFYYETMEYVRQLRAAGVDAEVDVYRDWFHAYDLFYPTKKIVRDAVRRFEDHFQYATEHYYAPQPEKTGPPPGSYLRSVPMRDGISSNNKSGGQILSDA
jgi:hypothetical protein